ncbi:MAG: NAD-dependent epimerase/dehydratase family protein [Bacteroidales bacterium]|nr:NAD-dependent epimerase/dehydratase family protein [Bacteroidales bacterium]MCF8402498.1 NAD-dependent epimerase/dehydratase family protein [Bacteroidales bacterium]
MKKYVLVTGANGYLGYYVCKRLISEGYHVIGLTYPHFASRRIENDLIVYFSYDLCGDKMQNPGLLNYLKDKKVLAILNLAALLGSSDYDKNFAVNAGGVKHMIEIAQTYKIRRFVQISSVVVLKKIKGPYGVTKLKGQEVLMASDLDYTIFIPAMILGPEGLGLNRVLKNVFRLPFIVPLIGNGKQTQHPIFVEDFAKYIVKCMEEPKANKKIYEIAGDLVIPFKDFISLILKIKNRKKFFIPIPVFVANWLGLFFQKTQKVPLFTAEHVKGVLQDSKLNTIPLQEDLGFVPTPLEKALKSSLDKIEDKWDYYLQHREEEIIKI